MGLGFFLLVSPRSSLIKFGPVLVSFERSSTSSILAMSSLLDDLYDSKLQGRQPVSLEPA